MGDLPAAAAVQGDMRRDGHADGLAHLGAGEAEQTRGRRGGGGDHLEARAAPAPADAVGSALRQAQEQVISQHGAQDHALAVTANGLHRRQHRGDGVAGVAAAMGVAVVVVVQVPGHHAIGKGRHIGRGLLAAHHHRGRGAGLHVCGQGAGDGGRLPRRGTQGAPNSIQNQALGPFDHLRRQVLVGEGQRVLHQSLSQLAHEVLLPSLYQCLGSAGRSRRPRPRVAESVPWYGLEYCDNVT